MTNARPSNGPATVLYVAWAPFLSGAERALLGLIDNLDPQRYRPIVVVGTRGELEAELTRRRVETYHVPITYIGPGTLPIWLTRVMRLAQIGRRHRAAIVHANDAPSFQPAGYTARMLGLPSIVHIRFPDTDQGFAWFLKPGFTRAIFVSHAIQHESMEAAPEIFAQRSEVIYDGVGAPVRLDDRERGAIRRELGLDAHQAVVALIGQIAEVKGIWDVIDAAEILDAHRVPVQFAIVGDDLKGRGALRVEAQRRVEAKGLGSRVRFLGFRRDVARVMAAFDLVVMPSHVEPLGLSALEAMAHARAVVGSRVGGIQETVVDGQTGLLIAPRNPQELASAVEALVREPERARALGRAGRQRVLDAFTIEGHGRRIQNLYDRMLSV
jgi:glycosyltransferase involved in cell wall biosynthesis